MLEVKELYCCYDNIDIINNVSFKVSNRENLCIVDSNGCGKNTLLKSVDVPKFMIEVLNKWNC